MILIMGKIQSQSSLPGQKMFGCRTSSSTDSSSFF